MFDLKNFPVTTELSSIAGVELSSLLTQAQQIQTDAFNLPDGILGKLTIDPIVLAAQIKQATQKPVIAHLTCRDSTRLGLASRLLGAASLGIDAILALSGDAGPKNVFEIRTPGLVKLIKELQTGYFDKQKLKSTPRLQIGVAVNPNVANQIDYLKRKVQAGADFVQTQPVFSLAVAEKFLANIQKAKIKIPILFGVMPLKNATLAKYFNQNVTGVQIPPQVLERLENEPEAGLKITLELLEKIHNKLAGVHIMPLGQIQTANKIYQFLKNQ